MRRNLSAGTILPRAIPDISGIRHSTSVMRLLVMNSASLVMGYGPAGNPAPVVVAEGRTMRRNRGVVEGKALAPVDFARPPADDGPTRWSLPMPVVAFDTLKLADRLQAGGFSAEQARTAASAFADAMSSSDVATKSDLKELRAELKAEIGSVRTEMNAMEQRLEAKIEASAAATKADLMRWMFGAMTAQTALIVGLVVGLVKLIH